MASWHRISIAWRLFAWLLVYSLTLTGCFVTFQYFREKDFKINELNSRLQLVNISVLTELEDGREISPDSLARAHNFADLRVTLIDSLGTVIYDNTLDPNPETNHLNRSEIAQARRSGTGFAVRRLSESTGNIYFYAAMRDDKNGMVIRSAVPYSVSLINTLKADYGFLWFMGAVTVAMCLIGYVFTRRLGQNIIRLNNFAEAAERGMKISGTQSFPHDELGDISSHIVRLYARLQQAVTDRDREHRAALHEQQEKERIKKQLTNNINHELKTPVASIQVCLETLLDHPGLQPEKREEFLRRCYANAERLRRLLADVSLITRMDDGGEAIMRERIDLSATIAEIVAEKEPAAEAAGMTIDCRIPPEVTLNGNPSLLASIFNNLIDNAISYSNGSEISIRLDRTDSREVTVTVADNGNGVPAQHLPHLFERFYRIDKGRSRAAGGTGLGLSIVKNAVQFHGGTISVANRPQGGLIFTFTLRIS